VIVSAAAGAKGGQELAEASMAGQKYQLEVAILIYESEEEGEEGE